MTMQSIANANPFQRIPVEVSLVIHENEQQSPSKTTCRASWSVYAPNLSVLREGIARANDAHRKGLLSSKDGTPEKT